MHYEKGDKSMPPDLLDQFLHSGTLISAGNKRLIVGYGKRKWHPSPPSIEKPVFYFPQYFLNDSMPWFTQEHVEELSLESFDELLSLAKVEKRSPLNWNCPQQELFNQAFDELQNLFSQNILAKAVPYVFEEAHAKLSQEQLIHSLKSLVKYALSFPVFLYGFWENGKGILGATPEMLFSLDHEKQKHVLNTVALAGTRKKDSSSLLDNPKEMREHQLVIEGITSSLSPIGEVLVRKTEEVHLPHLSHLMTPIHMELDVKPLFSDVVKKLHPTPALGAYPKEAGMQWLRSYQQKINRKRYGAPVGYHQGIKSICYVAIRNMQWDENLIQIGAGCGVIAASQKEQEWEEIKLKLKSIRNILSL